MRWRRQFHLVCVTLLTHAKSFPFSLKEAIYKAVHPLICQYVGFQEAEVTPWSDGTATCEWFLESGAHERLDKLTANWQKLDSGDFFLTSASAELREGV